MTELVRVAAVQLNVLSLDFENILVTHIRSIHELSDAGIDYAVFPELSLTGYGCEDHFHESDTELHALESLKEIVHLSRTLANCPVLELGSPITFRGAVYNCRVIVKEGSVIGIRPKMIMAMSGNYREGRYFTSWMGKGSLERMNLTDIGDDIPFGVFALAFDNATVAPEICEEMWCGRAPHIDYFLSGVDIVTNGSGSEACWDKACVRMDNIKTACSKNGGIYVYANFSGCDGSRVIYDGWSSVCLNGEFKAIGSASKICTSDAEIVAAECDLALIKMRRRANPTYGKSYEDRICRIRIYGRLGSLTGYRRKQAPTVEPVYRQRVDYILDASVHWLWDYFCRTENAVGFFLPLSGGADSAAVAYLIRYMAKSVMTSVHKGNDFTVKRFVQKFGEENVSKSVDWLMARLLYTSYIQTANSSDRTRDVAVGVSRAIGATHLTVDIQPIFDAFLKVMNSSVADQQELNYVTEGGTGAGDLVLQNLQSRTRMVLSYALAAMGPEKIPNKPGGFRLVLGTGNASELLRGYLTKYDCSSGDLNPIASLNKLDVKLVVQHAANKFEAFKYVAQSTPSAELRPALHGEIQNDEADMGITYEDLSVFGRLRMERRCGPAAIFKEALNEWPDRDVEEIAKAVKHFFRSYGQNRHKAATITPGLHLFSDNPDDNRHDCRQIIYPNWERQFNTIDAALEELLREAGSLNSPVVHTYPVTDSDSTSIL